MHLISDPEERAQIGRERPTYGSLHGGNFNRCSRQITKGRRMNRHPPHGLQLAVFLFIRLSVSYCAARHRKENRIWEEGGGGEGSPLSFFKGTREPARSRSFFSFSFFLFHSSLYLRLFDCFVYDTGIKIRSVG